MERQSVDGRQTQSGDPARGDDSLILDDFPGYHAL